MLSWRYVKEIFIYDLCVYQLQKEQKIYFTAPIIFIYNYFGIQKTMFVYKFWPGNIL